MPSAKKAGTRSNESEKFIIVKNNRENAKLSSYLERNRKSLPIV